MIAMHATRTASRAVHPNLALTVIAAAQLMVVLDATIVNIALPNVQRSLHFSNTSLSWVLNSYTLVFGGLLLLGGRTGDLFGRRRMFVVGVSLFAVASLAGGLAQDKGWLLAMRSMQGVGGAIASPTALSLVATTFEEGRARARAFGVYAAVSGAGAAIGLILGGVLTDFLTWRWVLFVNVPIGALIAFAAPRVIPDSGRGEMGALDVPGAVLSTAGMASLVYGFIHSATYGWRDRGTLVAFAAAAILLTAFVTVELRSSRPLMPLRLFRDRSRVGCYLVMLILGAAVFATFFFLTQYIQKVHGFSPLQAGFAFLPMSAVIVTMAQIASRIVHRVGPQLLVTAGTILVGFGLLTLSSLSPGSSYPWHVLPGILLVAAGMGSIFVPVTLGAVSGVAAEDAGIASAMLNVGQQVGGTLGLSALVSVFSSAARRAASHAPHGSAPAIAHYTFTHGTDAAFKTGALFALAGLVAAFVLIRVGPLGERAEGGPAL
ncbi:MAG TPA: MFS transporter [Mycobacteriales bacterium]|nr:MFS transporter [Mycobacteriales bacterium]